MARPLSIAIVGAGIGGLAAAPAFRRVGIDVTVYEQAAQFIRLGAGIQIGCNAMKVWLGLESRLRAQSFYPRSWNNRDWRTGAVKFDMIFGESAEQKFGAPYLLAHRGTLSCFRVAWKASSVTVSRMRFAGLRQARKDRTARIQQTSRTNTWLKEKTDTDWVYAYDAWTAPLAA
jgi:hypothetical protein